MTAYAPSPYQVTAQIERPSPQVSQEEQEKLQEIHELINLLFRELPVTAQQTVRPLAQAAAPAVPYTYSFFRFP